MAEQGPLSNQTLGGKYLLGELLGQGGFGAVYQARHTLLNRQQAVKILLEQHFTSAKFRERFIREAQTLAALDHPNIVHVDDFGFDGNRAYLVMPYIGGGSLQDILRRRGPLPLGDVTRYLEQICVALDYAHTSNVVHLDLKPLNLLVHQDGRLLLSDFGLAHLMEEEAIKGSTSLQFGTPTYMAPEHLQGQPERRSDIYALGIILYQMLAGRAPFEGSNAAAIMLKHLTEPPPSLRALRSDLPAGDGVLARALAKRADDRYQSAGALLADFNAAPGGQVSQPTSGIGDMPTRPSQAPFAPTLQAQVPLAPGFQFAPGLQSQTPLAAWEQGGAAYGSAIQGMPGPKAAAQAPIKKEPGGLLSRKSIQWLSLSAIVALLIYYGSIPLASYLLAAVGSLTESLLYFSIWILGLIRTAKMKTWGWFAAIFFALPIGYLLDHVFGRMGGGFVGLVLSFIIALLFPLTIFAYSRRS